MKIHQSECHAPTVEFLRIKAEAEAFTLISPMDGVAIESFLAALENSESFLSPTKR